MIQRIILCIAVLLMVSNISIGQSESTPEGITLTIFGEPGPGCSDPSNSWDFCIFSRSLIESFEAEYPWITLEFIEAGWDAELYANLSEAIANDEAPDITIGETFLPLLMRDGLLLEVDLPEEIIDNIVPGTLSYVTEEEVIYGVPIFTSLFTLEINSDVFYAANLLPELVPLGTWDEVLEASETILQNSNGNYYGHSLLGPTNLPAASLFRAAPYIYMTGAEFCADPLCMQPTLNDSRAIIAYEWFRSLYQTTPPGLFDEQDEGAVFSRLFIGEVGIQTAGGWHISWAEGNGCVDCRYYPLPVPTEDTPLVNTVVGNAIYAGLKSTDHPEEVQLFLEWILRDDIQNQLLLVGVGGRLPVTFSALNNIELWMTGDVSSVPSFFEEDLGKEPEDATEIARQYSSFITQLVNDEVRSLPHWEVELAIIWNEMFYEIVTSDRPIQEIMDEYQILADNFINESYSSD